MNKDLIKIVYYNEFTKTSKVRFKQWETDVHYNLSEINKYIEEYWKQELLDAIDWMKNFIINN